MFVGSGMAMLGLDKRSKLRCGCSTFLYGLFHIRRGTFQFPTHFVSQSFGDVHGDARVWVGTSVSTQMRA